MERRCKRYSGSGHKSYYFTSDFTYLNKMIVDPKWCAFSYENFAQNTKVKLGSDSMKPIKKF